MAKVLGNQFHTIRKSRTLQGFANLSQHCPPALYVINGLNTLRKRFRKNTLSDRAGLSGSTYLSYLQPSHYAESGVHVDYGIPS